MVTCNKDRQNNYTMLYVLKKISEFKTEILTTCSAYEKNLEKRERLLCKQYCFIYILVWTSLRISQLLELKRIILHDDYCLLHSIRTFHFSQPFLFQNLDIITFVSKNKLSIRLMTIVINTGT